MRVRKTMYTILNAKQNLDRHARFWLCNDIKKQNQDSQNDKNIFIEIKLIIYWWKTIKE